MLASLFLVVYNSHFLWSWSSVFTNSHAMLHTRWIHLPSSIINTSFRLPVAAGLGFHLIHAALVNTCIFVNNQTTFSATNNFLSLIQKTSLSYVLFGVITILIRSHPVLHIFILLRHRFRHPIGAFLFYTLIVYSCFI